MLADSLRPVVGMDVIQKSREPWEPSDGMHECIHGLVGAFQALL